MKNINSALVIIFLAVTGCGGGKQSTDELVTVDVTKSYPKKELILQDFMDVEYIPLETTGDFINQGLVQAVGKNIVIVKNRTNDGDIFIYDRNGKALRKINRRGQGGEEYTYYVKFVLDEDSNELFVNDMYSKKIIVYDLEGNFRRILPHEGEFLFYEMYDFDRDNLICRDGFNDSNTRAFHSTQSFMIVSKQDGRITKEITIPYKEKKSMMMISKDDATGLTYIVTPSTIHPIVPSFDNYVLVELSADTMYSYSQDHEMKPLIVRTPSLQSMTPEVFLLLSILTDRYYFMEAVKKESGYPGDDIMYDRQERKIFRYVVYNDDYSNKEQVFMKSIPINHEIPSRMILEAPDLVRAYQKGQLKGRLKEIAATLDEESNPVIMLIKHKK